MKTRYTIQGMTCGNCKASVEEKLSTLTEIKEVQVSLENGSVDLTSTIKPTLKVLQEALPSKYTINELASNSAISTKQTTSELKQLFPLFLIFTYLFGASFLLNYSDGNSSEFMLDFMGLFYIVFSFFKLLDLKGFPASFRMYDPLAKRLPVYGWIYPFIELALGLLFLTRIRIDWALIATLIILGITTFGVTKVLLDKKSIQCACLGTALKLPMTKATFIENSVMLIMALIMLFN